MAVIKTTHVGSLPRPKQMQAKMLRHQEISIDELRQYLTAIMDKQLSMGITYVNNGELPRTNYVQATINRISGFSGTSMAPFPQDLEEIPELSRRFSARNELITLNPKAPVTLPVCSHPLFYTGESSLQQELEMLDVVYHDVKTSYLEKHSEIFFTSPSPGTIALFMDNIYYPSYKEYLDNLTAVLKQEYDLINQFGFYLQIDCPDLAMGRHTRFKHLTDDEFLTVIEMNIHALNQALTSIDPAKCRAHICWGNYSGTHHCDIDLKKIFNRITAINAKFISVEASNHRHAHEWTVFEKLTFPEDKVLMPGVIDTASNIVEHPDLVAQRLSNFARILGPDRVIASTDCGFATTASSAGVTGEVAWHKLAALVEGARRAGKNL